MKYQTAMNKLFTVLSLLFIFLIPNVYADESKKETDTTDPVYKKLFKDTTKLHTQHGMMTVHRYDGKLYFEMPVELFRREFLLRTIISKSNKMNFSGTVGAPQRYITIERIDSMIVYKEHVNNLALNPNDSIQIRAMKLSKGDPIFRLFPIKGYTRDSLNVIYEVTDFYKPENKEILNLKGLFYSSLITISGAVADSRNSFLNKVCVYQSSVMVNNTFSATLDLSFLGLLTLKTKPKVTIESSTYFVLLPEKAMTPRLANQNVGTGIVPFYDYRPLVDTKWKYYVTRHRLEKDGDIVFYIDSLIPSDWCAAIEDAAGEWNKVFSRNGLGMPIKIQPYPTDTTFSFEDPVNNVIYLTNSASESMKTSNILDLRTGEILSSRISVSRDAANGIRRVGITQLAAVDERFRTYFTPADALYEGIRGIALRSFGYALGLSDNYAGSYAYSPEQIRSAAFTRRNGFTASVMDNVLYNTLALPGDKEKGVRLVIDRVGSADEFALRYLYGAFGDAEKEEKALKAFVRKHEGDPKYLYIGEYAIVPSDPRGQSGDLGNDPLVYLQNRTANMKYLIRESPDWFTADSIPNTFKVVFPDVVMGEYFSSVLSPLFAYIGGIYINEANQSSALPPYTIVDKALQKKVTQAILTAGEDMSWLDSNRDLLYMGGVNTSISEYAIRQGLPIKSLMQRLKYLSLSVSKSKDPYTHEEYLRAVESYVFSDVIKGKPMSMNKQNLLRAYLSSLVSLSPALTDINKKNKKNGSKKSFMLVDDTEFSADELMDDSKQWLINLRLSDEVAARRLQTISYFSLEDLTPLVYEALGRARKTLEKSKARSKDRIYRGKMDYFLSMIKKLQEPVK